MSLFALVIQDYPLSLWLYAFVWTLALEWPIYTLLLHRSLGTLQRHIAILLLINLATHPALWYIFPRFQPPILWIWVAESWVTLTEATLLFFALRGDLAQERLQQLGQYVGLQNDPLRLQRSPRLARLLLGLLAAILANTFSTLVGFLIL